jgi:hypothetical protein
VQATNEEGKALLVVARLNTEEIRGNARPARVGSWWWVVMVDGWMEVSSQLARGQVAVSGKA